MKKIKMLSIITIILILALDFSVFAMTEKKDEGGTLMPNPLNETQNEYDRPYYIWTWLSDAVCVNSKGAEGKSTREHLQFMYDMGVLSQWSEPKNDGSGTWKAKPRDTYNGKWSQSETGIWSFKFDDMTIPIELTRIDDVLYAFNGYGELVEGIEYWNGYKTGADGVVTCTEPEFLEWLETQYIPECTTSKTE